MMHHTGDPLEEPVVRTGTEEHCVLRGGPALPRFHFVPARADVTLLQLALFLFLALNVSVVRHTVLWGVRRVAVGVMGVWGLVRVVRGVALCTGRRLCGEKWERGGN